MNPFLQQLIDELKAFSHDLLTPGLQAAQWVASDTSTVASTNALLKSIGTLTQLIPALVSELQNTGAMYKLAEHYTTQPKGAVMSRRANDYQYDAKKRRLLPSHWLASIPQPELDVRPLRWVLHLLALQEQNLNNVQQRTNKYIDNSLRVQQGSSTYAQNDRNTLFGMRHQLYAAQTKLENARATLFRTVPLRFVPSPTLPHPYPNTPAWGRLRQYAHHLLNPSDYLPGFLHNLMHGTVEIADTPYLYQRWCGMKLLEGLEVLGWRCPEDPVGALFLGGALVLHKQDARITLWIEPRFPHRRQHPSGFRCPQGGETHPDYMLVTPGMNGVDAFILDPTTSNDWDIRHSKSKYLSMLETDVIIAGIPTVRGPLRAWSAAPLHTPHCEIEDPDGVTGTIPMHPLDWSEEPLLLWLNDIDRHALAWTERFH